MFLITATNVCFKFQIQLWFVCFFEQYFWLDISNGFCKTDNREVDYTGKDYKDFKVYCWKSNFVCQETAFRTSVSDC